MLPGMLSFFLSGAASVELFLIYSASGPVTAFCYAKTEALAGSTWNMLARSAPVVFTRQRPRVPPRSSREERLRAREQRVLIVDSSAADACSRTRIFYLKNGYVEEARIRYFWVKGENMIVFWKAF